MSAAGQREIGATDLRLQDEGTIWLLWPETDQGREWMDLNVERGPTFGPATAVEPRYVEDIVEGARADGLTVG